jgi:uncharacterized protein YkwD
MCYEKKIQSCFPHTINKVFGSYPKRKPKSTAIMRKLLSIFLIAITLIAPAQTRTINGAFDYGKARHIMNNINNLRNAKGLKPLQMETCLTEAAMLRAAEIAYRQEVEQPGELAVSPGKRPNGDDNLALITEQYHTTTPFSSCEYLHHEQVNFVDIGSVIKALKSKSNGTSAIYSTSMRAIGCGAFLSERGHFYWVLYFLPSGNKQCNIPSGQNVVTVSVALKRGEHTKTVTQTKSDTDLTPTSFEVSGHFNYEKAIKVAEIVNKERTAKGLKPCIMDSTLTELAMIRAAEMKGIKKMTHTRPNGLSGTFIISDGMAWSHTGENIAYGQGTAEEVMSQWMNSSGHRRNILNDDYVLIGVGECDGYWVQLFARTKYRSRALKRSDARTDEVVVEVTTAHDGKSKVVKRKRAE